MRRPGPCPIIRRVMRRKKSSRTGSNSLQPRTSAALGWLCTAAEAMGKEMLSLVVQPGRRCARRQAPPPPPLLSPKPPEQRGPAAAASRPGAPLPRSMARVRQVPVQQRSAGRVRSRVARSVAMSACCGAEAAKLMRAKLHLQLWLPRGERGPAKPLGPPPPMQSSTASLMETEVPLWREGPRGCRRLDCLLQVQRGPGSAASTRLSGMRMMKRAVRLVAAAVAGVGRSGG
mmetsp:Transcript_24460/g.63107  ORF Transcript_24460/g.63107 Transcript_24460/m.63107 type:complete len:231 (+) Transcript_24460:61-753(+)